jgi:ferritin
VIKLLKEEIQKVLNKQLNSELYSAYLYLSMSSYFESISLSGFANWMRVQAQEELTHAMKFYDYLVERDGRVKLTSIESPPTDWNSPLEAFEHTYKHEQKVTSLINNLVNLTLSEKDYATNNMLQWFIAEQVEEESSVNAVLQRLKLVGNERKELFMIDRDLAQRVFTGAIAFQKQSQNKNIQA